MANTCPKQWYCSVSKEGCTAEKMAGCEMVPKQGDPNTTLFVTLLDRSLKAGKLAERCPETERHFAIFFASGGEKKSVEWIIHDLKKVLSVVNPSVGNGAESAGTQEGFLQLVQEEVRHILKTKGSCDFKGTWFDARRETYLSLGGKEDKFLEACLQA